MVRVGPLLDRLLNAKNVVAFLLSIFTLLLRLRLVSFLAFGYLLVGCFYCWASVKVLSFLPPHLFVLLTDDFTVCASASRSSAPRSLEKRASQGPRSLVNLPPQWGSDGRQQSAPVMTAVALPVLNWAAHPARFWAPPWASVGTFW